MFIHLEYFSQHTKIVCVENFYYYGKLQKYKVSPQERTTLEIQNIHLLC